MAPLFRLANPGIPFYIRKPRGINVDETTRRRHHFVYNLWIISAPKFVDEC